MMALQRGMPLRQGRGKLGPFDPEEAAAHAGIVRVVWQLAVLVVPTIIVLGVLNALPQWLGGEPLGVVRYASIERVESRHHARLWRPSTLPAEWIGPPFRVRLAAGSPDWVQFVFEPAAREDAPLIVCQTISTPADAVAADTFASSERDVPEVLLPRGELLQATDFSVGGREIRMRRLVLDSGAVVNDLWWREGASRVMLRLAGSSSRVVAVARKVLDNRP